MTAFALYCVVWLIVAFAYFSILEYRHYSEYYKGKISLLEYMRKTL